MLETKEVYINDRGLREAIKEVQSTQQKSSPHHSLRRIYQQGKQISQIVAFIWRWADDTSHESIQKKQVAQELKTYFTNPSPSVYSPMATLKKLLTADARNPQISKEAKLLSEVFSSIDDCMIFPMFDEFELGEECPELGYLFEIDINSFQGALKDASLDQPQLLKWTIAYPPRPELSEVTVTPDELDKWVNNRASNQYIPDNRYIPASSC